MQIQKDKLLSSLTTIKVGGKAKEYTSISSYVDLRIAFAYAKEHHLDVFILGKGSNLLCNDEGFDGLVIHNKINFVEFQKNEQLHVYIGAGYSFSLLGSQTAREGYTGLEFASGIPASVGGAIFMNAGANGSETCDCLTEVEFLDLNGNVSIHSKESLAFSYRYSSFQKMRGAIVGARFALNPSPLAREKQLNIIQYRKNTQPLTDPSAGCIFRNPEAEHAGALIEKCGLKGLQEGSAAVSTIHGNFIINKGGAQAKDIEALIAKIQQEVKLQTGFFLESEVRRLPYVVEKKHDI